MGDIANKSFNIPYRDKLLGQNGLLSSKWEFFFRSLWDRINPLGLEKSFEIVNNVNAKTFSAASVDTSGDFITKLSHGFYTGLVGQMTTDGTLPTGISGSTDYYVIKASESTFKLATSEALATAGTAIDITAQGSGNHTFTPRGKVTDMVFDKRGVSAVFVDFLIQRVTTSTGAVETIEAGSFMATYNPTSDDWNLGFIGTPGPDDTGVDLSISSSGQVEYTSTSIADRKSVV